MGKKERFDIRSEKLLKVILKGISHEITEEEVKEDLEVKIANFSKLQGAKCTLPDGSC